MSANALGMGIHVHWCVDHDGAAKELKQMVRVFCGGIEKDYHRLDSENQRACGGAS
jgi:hypothetical protein